MWVVVAGASHARVPAAAPPQLPGTLPLTTEGDIASLMVSGVDEFLDDQIERSVQRRNRYWNRDFSSPVAYDESIRPNRQRLAHLLGVRDPRRRFRGIELCGTTQQSSLVGQSDAFEVHAVRWPVLGDVEGEGLMLLPKSKPWMGEVIAIPDANQLPEQIVGLIDGVAPASQYARRLAESGFRVVVPVLINRQERLPQLTNREYLYRSAFELGRHLIGYELQKVLALVDWYSDQAGGDVPVGVVGWGEGGLLALYAGALDTRIDAVCVSGYFEDRGQIWKEPIDRNVFGLLEQFGDAELASMIAPRKLVVEASRGPEFVIPPRSSDPRGRGAPGRLVTPALVSVKSEVQRARQLVAGLAPEPSIELVVNDGGLGPYGNSSALRSFLTALNPTAELVANRGQPVHLRKQFDASERHDRQWHQIDRHNQWLLRESPYVRQKYMEKVDTSSMAAFEESIEPYREYFREEVIGRFDVPLLEPHVRTRLTYENDQWVGYEVVLDVFPHTIAYGILLLPRDLRPDEKRPVIVCQHGLEGRPQDVIGEKGYPYYKAFASQLAERGFITFAPQNPYIFGDRFRTLQRKANPLKKTLFSIIVPQHQQIVNWLKTLPGVDPERIGFYGLSYGGKTAMRVPPLVADYCLSICSADFNDWVDKNASTRNPHSYVRTGEYEIFEFDLGSTFNYAEMAALIAPRPLMVERGHFDGVASDETVGWEFAKVRHLYAARLGYTDRCRIEWFVGPHTIHGQGTFDFLHQHLHWPTP